MINFAPMFVYILNTSCENYCNSILNPLKLTQSTTLEDLRKDNIFFFDILTSYYTF